MLTCALDGGYSLRLVDESDVMELYALIAANREHLARVGERYLDCVVYAILARDRRRRD